MAQHSFEEYDKIFSVPRSGDQTHTFDKYIKTSDGDLNVIGDLHSLHESSCSLLPIPTHQSNVTVSIDP